MASKKKDTTQAELGSMLTKDELLDVGNEIAQLVDERDKLDEKRKAIAKKYRDQIGGLDEKISRLAEQIREKRQPMIDEPGLFGKANGEGAEAE